MELTHYKIVWNAFPDTSLIKQHKNKVILRIYFKVKYFTILFSSHKLRHLAVPRVYRSEQAYI